MKKLFLYLSVAALAMTMSACGGNNDDDEEEEDEGMNPKKMALKMAEKECECNAIWMNEGATDEYMKCMEEFEAMTAEQSNQIDKRFQEDAAEYEKFWKAYNQVYEEEREKCEMKLSRILEEQNARYEVDSISMVEIMDSVAISDSCVYAY